MQILSDIQPYDNPDKPVYSIGFCFRKTDKRRHKVFKVKPTALDFINQVKAWNKVLMYLRLNRAKNRAIQVL